MAIQPHQLRFLSTCLAFGTLMLLAAVLSGEEHGVAPMMAVERLPTDASADLVAQNKEWLKVDINRLDEMAKMYEKLEASENALLIANRIQPEDKLRPYKTRIVYYSNKASQCYTLATSERKLLGAK